MKGITVYFRNKNKKVKVLCRVHVRSPLLLKVAQGAGYQSNQEMISVLLPEIIKTIQEKVKCKSINP